MSRYHSLLAILVCHAVLIGSLQADDLPLKKDDPVDLTNKASYAIGMNIGSSIKADGLELNADQLIAGLMDALGDKKLQMTKEEAQTVLRAFERQRVALAAEKNLKAGTAFLAANKRKAGVVTLPSGLQYKVIKQGNGPSPKATDRVKTHYHGTLLNGNVFDSSVDRGEPAVFPVNRVIAGWTEALQKMKVGDKWQLVVPSKLAYGERGAGGQIGPNTTLIFEVELLAIEK